MSRRIGIFSGVFDPVHDGHIQFALKAIKQAKLDKVYFLAEVKPRRKTGITHLAHRIAMLKLATKNYSVLEVLELPDRQFSVAKTLPRLNQKFFNDELFLIAGSDTLEYLSTWPLIDQLISRMNLIIGLRWDFPNQKAEDMIKHLPTLPEEIFIIKSPRTSLSSAKIRQNLAKNKSTPGLTPKVKDYIIENWLYVAV